MGLSAEKMREEHGSGEYVVLHNLVMVRDQDDSATDPKDFTFSPASRGDRVTLDGHQAKRLLAEGAIAKPDADSAQFAEAGMRDPSILAVPPSATQLAPESERVMATKAALGDRFGDPNALYKLDAHQLKHVAIAFGIPFKANATKEDLAKAILGTDAGDAMADHADAVEARGSARQQSDLHPDQQVKGREASFKGPEGGSSRSSSGGSSDADENGGDAEATDSARQFADEHGIDLAEVQGSGAGGRITQADVVKYHADQSSGD